MHDDRWQEMTVAECTGLLAGQQIGRIALTDRTGPVIFPVTYVMAGDDIVIRTGEGTKLDAARGRVAVAFEIDEIDHADRSGWSVLVRGQAAAVTDPAMLDRLRSLELTPWAPGDRRHYVRILPTAITGRRISLAAGLTATWLG